MGRVDNQIKLIAEKCNILYKNQIVSSPELLKAFIRYFIITFNKKDHNVGLILHTDSVCFDVISIAYSALINLISNQSSSEDFLNTLKKGDMVLYKTDKKTERYRYGYKEIKNEKEYIVLYQDKKDGKEYNFVPSAFQNRISPYNGNSIREDGRGIRSKNNTAIIDFYTEVLNVLKADIPSIFDTSSIIITSKDKTNLVKDISIQFGTKTVPLTALTTAAYFTDIETPLYLGINPGKTEVLLKFVSKVSVARALLRSRDSNNHIGVMILGDQTIHRSESELPGIINKQSLKYVYISNLMNSQFSYNLLKENEDINLFACTKKFVEKYPVNTKTHSINPLLIQLAMQTAIISNKKIEPKIIDSILNWETYASFKKALSIIQKNDFNSEDKDEFVKYAFSIMKIFSTAVFSLSDLEKYNLDNENLTVHERINELKILESKLPSILKDKTSYVIDTLEKLFSFLSDSTPKEEILKKLVVENRGKRIAIILPKGYYISVMHLCPTFNTSNLFCYTTNNFPGNEHFDIIVPVGNVAGNKFNILACNSSETIIPLFYEHENKKFKFEKKYFNEANKLFITRSTIKSKSFLIPEDEAEFEDIKEVEIINKIDAELNNYISDIELNLDIKHFTGNHSGKSSALSEVVKAATFTDGTKALFTKHYKAYVFNQYEGKIEEKNVEEISDGDSLVFTQNNNETKDIVDTVLKQLIDENKLQISTEEAYQKSKKWKQNLHDYMQKNNLNPRKLCKLEDKNLGVTELTIRQWMDEDSHTVGPRDIESIVKIALLTEDKDMEREAETYYQACAEIRKLRRNILDKIGQAIIDRLSRKSSETDIISQTVFEKIEDLSVILEIENIVSFEKEVPIYIVNRPLNM